MRRILLAALAAAILALAGCGFIGYPLTPLANIPTRITDLAAVERGAVLIAHFTVPTHTTENNLIERTPQLDLRVGPAGEKFNPEAWAAQARPASNPRIQDGLATFEIPVADWIGKSVAIGARTLGPNGKEAEWSNFVTLPVVAPLPTPSKPSVTDIAAGERITWTGPGSQFRVLRRIAGELNYTVVATLAEHEWTDTGIEYGKSYAYEIQAIADAGAKQIAESDLSPVTEQTPVDIFPPAVPSGLRADPSPNSATLVWEPDTDPDLAGYRVYRSTGDGPWTKLADINTIPSYNDASIEHGKTYHYAVTAYDKTGNESQRSAAVEVVFP